MLGARLGAGNPIRQTGSLTLTIRSPSHRRLRRQPAYLHSRPIGGVITSTLLTLIVVPVIYSYLDELAAWAKRRFGVRAASAAGGAMPQRMPAAKE